jgi:hypothetical protein
VSENTPPPGTTEPIADAGETDRRLIIAFVVCMLLGLAVLGWHYHSSDKTTPMCGTPDAHCGEKDGSGRTMTNRGLRV